MTSLNNKVAIVTGSTRGIGLAIATSFIEKGAKVVISSRKAENVTTVARELNHKHPGMAYPFPLHVGKTDLHQAFIEEIIEKVGFPTILVNNAAANPYFGPMINLQWAAWDKTIEVNLKGPFSLSKELAKKAIAQKKPISIINISSIFGLHASPGQGIYGMTKAALIDMTKTLSHEWGRVGIRVNAIAPGLVETKFASAILDNPTFAKQYANRSALNRHGKPNEIAGIAVYLASDESSFTTGQTFVVDGGYSCQ